MKEIDPDTMLPEGKIAAPVIQEADQPVEEPGEKRVVIVDSDDLSDQLEERNCLPFLLKFKEKHPNFKITLWTIPGECSEKFLADASGYDWIELGIHGYKHADNYEFANLSMTEATILLLQAYRQPYFQPIFKAPGWQISDGTYGALQLMGIGVMDQKYNNERRPEDLLTVVYSDEDSKFVHTHTWDCCGNFVENVLEEAGFDENTEFKLVSECMELAV